MKNSMKGLIIKSPYIELILEGKKKWEIRGSRTNIRGTICLIKSGSKKIFGEVDIVDCVEIDFASYNNHCIELYGKKENNLPYKRTYAWVLKNPKVYDTPKDYNHPLGAIIWVNLDNI
jgi:predicted transcriptional regulator